MGPHRSTACARPALRPLLWVFVVMYIGGLNALVPNEQKDSLVRTTPLALLGVQTTPLTTTSGSFEKSSFRCGNGSCENYCSFCRDFHLSKTDCYNTIIPLCSQQFRSDMNAMNNSSWCMWDKVNSPYNKLTKCTEDVADCLLIPWPNKLVEQIFVDMHTSYFQECPEETLRDPPPNVVFALVMTPICLIPAMVVLVVLKTKNGDRRS
ncbi:receptor activity-modifying protein 1-like [Astyanax mexicanus]|uniref:Receptor activity modifying protein 1 n=1 Tax=Astyanax mexicanus TaxID=7994 RepID=A0A8B9HJE8_ASTMX|nr:receptor activity-modifying protein 1-like [Astyanax mexicanus]